MRFDDEDPVWERHTGGPGHDGPEWADGDQEQARFFYESVAEGTRRVLDLLMARPGELINAMEIYRYLYGRRWSSADPNWRKSVAATLNSVWNIPRRDEPGRRLPYYWWEPSEDEDTQYGMKPAVARVFRDAVAR